MDKNVNFYPSRNMQWMFLGGRKEAGPKQKPMFTSVSDK